MFERFWKMHHNKDHSVDLLLQLSYIYYNTMAMEPNSHVSCQMSF